MASKETIDRESVLRMAQGAIEEKVDYEVSRVIDNILDMNTKPDAKRKITVTLEVVPYAERKRINLFVNAKSALVPTAAVATSMMITTDRNGEIVVAEMVPQIPGQMNFAGEEQEQPKILRLINQA